MIDRRIFSALLASCPAFVQRAIAARLTPQTEADLCDQIIAVLRRRRPELMATVEIGPCELRIDQRIIYLGNLATRLRQEPAAKWEAIVLEFTDNVLASTQSIIEADGATQPFDAIRKQLYPQIVASDYVANQAPGTLSRPFSRRASIAIVEDKGGMHRFLRDDEAASWSLHFASIEAVAVENLERVSTDVPITMERGANGTVLCVISINDGFDAARILVPSFRRRLLASASTPLQAAIPTRDTLLVWTPGVANFGRIRDRVRGIYDEGPYSRTDEIFELKAESVRPI